MFDILTNFFRNEMNYLTGKNQEFEELLRAGDVSRAIGKMQCLKTRALELYAQYDPELHRINKRPDKIITNKLGKLLRVEKTAKIPVPYQQYINEVALVFLLGRPLTWSNKSEGCDEAFEKFQWVLKHTHFNAKIREAKRIAGAEGESALLFRVFRDDDGNPDIQIRVLAASKGDDIYTRWDVYGNLLTAAWGYSGKNGNDTTECLEIYTPDTTYHCLKARLGWEITEEANMIGKIGMIIFRQEEEHHGAQPLIERVEHKRSRTADTNDYLEDPILMLHGDIIKNLPEKKEAAKTLVIKGDDISVNDAAKYLTYDQASEAKKEETDFLDDAIMNLTFTPKITLDTMRQISQMSAKAMRTVLLLGYIKADRRKDTWDEMMDRTASLIKAIVGNVLDVSLAKQCNMMEIEHQWQEPFGDDITEQLQNVATAFGAGIMSEETAIEQNPLVKDKELEKERLRKEQEERQKIQNDIFGSYDGDEGAGTGE